MKKIITYLLFGAILTFSNSLYAVNSAPLPVKEKLTKKEEKKLEKQQKKAAKWEKRMKKLKKKLEKKGLATGGGVWDDDTFRLGALIALGGLLIRLFAFLPFIGGIFSLIGSLVFLVGLGIMIWVLIEG